MLINRSKIIRKFSICFFLRKSAKAKKSELSLHRITQKLKSMFFETPFTHITLSYKHYIIYMIHTPLCFGAYSDWFLAQRSN